MYTSFRILSIAKKYNYYPNLMAVSLHSKSTKTIGVIIPNILNYFFVNALHGIEKETRLRGYKIIICISNEFQISVKYLGVGEGINDLQVFDRTAFVDALLAALCNGVLWHLSSSSTLSTVPRSSLKFLALLSCTL